MFITVLLLTLLAVLFHWEWVRKFTYWKRKGIPFVAGSFPFGSSRSLTTFSKFQGKTLQELYKKLSPNPFGGIYIWNYPVLLLCDPDVIRTVMTKDFQHFRNRGRLETSPNQPLSQHLFNLDGDLWRAVRVKLTPTFSSGRLKNMFSLFETCSAQLDQELKKITNKGEPINIKELTTCFTLDLISSCAFGLESNTAENEEFRKNSQKIFLPYVKLEMKIKGALYFMFPFLPKLLTLRFIDKDVENFIMGLVSNTVKYREDNNVTRNDFLDLMIQLKNKGALDGEKKDKNVEAETSSLEMTPGLLAAQCFVFFAAGFETSSSVQAYAFYELALNQDIQNKLRQEIDEVTRKHGGKATYQAFHEMHYMEQVISEVIRKHPTLPLLNRQCSKTFTLPGNPNITIDKGTKLLIPVYALHHDPQYFPDPEKFDPDRFSPENKPSIIPYSYLPFGEGPRHCIGMRFGMLQTKMGLYTVLSKYKVLPSKETPAALNFVASAIVSTVGGPIKLIIQPRDDLTTNSQ